MRRTLFNELVYGKIAGHEMVFGDGMMDGKNEVTNPPQACADFYWGLGEPARSSSLPALHPQGRRREDLLPETLPGEGMMIS